jgi:ADP-ribose pyrophosphatase YjhB (NUDIX family)
MPADSVSFCSRCGRAVDWQVPDGDTLPRHVCAGCGTVHYQNPKIVVGCVPEQDGRILLCKRAIPPRAGYWTLPAGFLENGESLEAGAIRETLEEAMARVEILRMLAVVDVIDSHQVHVTYAAKLLGSYGAGHETLDARLFEAADVPWADIAFRSVEFALRRYLDDRASGVDRLHTTAIRGLPPP